MTRPAGVQATRAILPRMPGTFGGMRAVAALALGCIAAACGDDGPSADMPDAGTTSGDWSYAAIEGAVCGNGSPWGVATNVRPGASEVLVFLAGGGACWDVETCYGVGAAVHFDEDLSAATVLAEARALENWLFSRDPQLGLLADASFVYVPYCTGDLHAGQRVAEYEVMGAPRAGHHVGATNLDRLLATWDELGLPSPERLWLSGISAGGYGVTLNWWRFRDRFPDAAAVDVLDDSGPAIDVPAARFAAWTAAWDLQQPPGCADCAEGLSRLLPHYAEAMPPGDRYAYLGHLSDAVIAIYYGDGAEVIASKHAELRVTLEASDRFGGFFLEGTDHVVLADPSRSTSAGLSALTWVEQFVADSPDWTTVGP